MPIIDLQGHKSIGRRLLMQSLVIALALTLFLSVLQVWMNYWETLTATQRTMQQIEKVQVPGIETALWNFSLPELTAQTESIIHFPFINYASVHDKGRTITEAGRKKTRSFLNKEIPLYHEEGSQRTPIGTLSIQADSTGVWTLVIEQINPVLFFQALNVVIVIFIFLVLVDNQVTRHLLAAANYFLTFDIKDLGVPLKLDKKPANDEIDSLVAAFNRMRKNLSDAYRQQNESERKYSTLLANLPGMAFRCKSDADWTMELASAGCLGLTGYEQEEIIGKPRLDNQGIIHFADREYVFQSITAGLAENRSYELTYRIHTKEGVNKWVLERGVGIYGEDGELQALEGLITDITKNRQQERELNAIAEVSNALRSAVTRDEMLPVILNQTVKLLNADGGALELIDPLTGDSVVELGYGAYQKLVGLRIPPDKGLNSVIRETGKPFLDQDVLNNDLRYYPDDEQVCRSIAGVPMIAHGQMIGFLWIGRKNTISEDAVQSLMAIADNAGSAIHRATLFDQTQQHLMELIGLRSIDFAINRNQDLPLTLHELLKQTVALLNVDAANIVLFQDDQQVNFDGGGIGFSTHDCAAVLLPSIDLWAGQTLRQGSMVKICHVEEFGLEPASLDYLRSEDFAAYFAAPLVAQNEVKGTLQVFLHESLNPGQNWVNFLETLAGQAAIAVSKAHLFMDLQQSNMELQMAYDATIEGWSKALDLRDNETEGHSQRVTELCLALAVKMGTHSEDLVNIRRGALLHDIGKVGVPDQILFKSGKLTDEEWEVMKMHPVNAYNLLSSISYLEPALDIPYCHHEKWDGSGYPRGLKRNCDPTGRARLRCGGCLGCADLRPPLPQSHDLRRSDGLYHPKYRLSF